MKAQLLSILRSRIKAQGCNGEISSAGADVTWYPREDSTPQQIALAQQMIAAFDPVAEDAAIQADAAMEAKRRVFHNALADAALAGKPDPIADAKLAAQAATIEAKP